MEDVYIIGVSCTPFGKQPQHSFKDLSRQAYLEVLADAERRHALDLADRLAAAEAERDALREYQGLPWWRRLLPSTSPKRLPGGGADEA